MVKCLSGEGCSRWEAARLQLMGGVCIFYVRKKQTTQCFISAERSSMGAVQWSRPRTTQVIYD